jgi:hypothetical protein
LRAKLNEKKQIISTSEGRLKAYENELAALSIHETGYFPLTQI